MKHEFILISVCVSHTRTITQFDDSCAHAIEKEIGEYAEVLNVTAEVHYKHTQTEDHPEECVCHYCLRVKDGGFQARLEL